MRGTTHMIGGAAATLALTTAAGITDAKTLLVGAAVGALGGLIPDIDHPNSKITHKTKFLGTIISRLFRHRLTPPARPSESHRHPRLLPFHHTEISPCKNPYRQQG